VNIINPSIQCPKPKENDSYTAGAPTPSLTPAANPTTVSHYKHLLQVKEDRNTAKTMSLSRSANVLVDDDVETGDTNANQLMPRLLQALYPFLYYTALFKFLPTFGPVHTASAIGLVNSIQPFAILLFDGFSPLVMKLVSLVVF
jgi:hypothetical protein